MIEFKFKQLKELGTSVNPNHLARGLQAWFEFKLKHLKELGMSVN